MSGESEAWYRLALKLQWPVQLLQKMTTSKEFLRWQVILEREPNWFDPLHYYLANIVNTLRNINRKKGAKASKLESCLLKFQEPKRRKPRKAKTVEEQIEDQKKRWFRASGLNSKGEPKKGRVQTRQPPQKKK